MPEHLYVYTHDHPLAGDREAEEGEVQWDFHVELEDGQILHVLMGEECYKGLRSIVLREDMGEAIDELIPEDL